MSKPLTKIETELVTALKHTAVVLAEIFQAQGLDPNGNQAFRDAVAAVKKAEGK